MKKKIEPKKYNNKLNKVFGTPPITYNEIDKVVENIKRIREEAFEMFKNREFYEAACFYKALLDNVLEYLNNVDDEYGKLSDTVYEFIRYFSESCKNSEVIDKEDFYNKSLKLYIEEDLGFTDEITHLIIDNIANDKEKNYLVKLIKNKLETDKLSKYNHNKLVELLLKIYRKYNEFDKYIETCKLMSEDRWERYVKPSEIYESLGEYENALQIVEEGMRNLPEHKDIFQTRYEDLKKRILGLK
ncbi:MAG: hypothetical protein ACOCV8_03655 [Spirochaetota bacterium]